MKEIKFRYRFKYSDGSIKTNYFTLEEIESHKGLNTTTLESAGVKILSRDLFTGLKDKNGKEIYEGDIVKISDYDNPLICEVKCKNLWKGLTFKQLSKGLYMTQGYSSEEEMGKNCEVIGNIWEDKELLEEEK